MSLRVEHARRRDAFGNQRACGSGKSDAGERSRHVVNCLVGVCSMAGFDNRIGMTRYCWGPCRFKAVVDLISSAHWSGSMTIKLMILTWMQQGGKTIKNLEVLLISYVPPSTLCGYECSL